MHSASGAASGIGRAVALLLAERGARLALTDLDSSIRLNVRLNERINFPTASSSAQSRVAKTTSVKGCL
jgi:NAD(P)-dependent dehydrogenase (short-subunit alcohol dehydrogenase family)